MTRGLEWKVLVCREEKDECPKVLNGILLDVSVARIPLNDHKETSSIVGEEPRVPCPSPRPSEWCDRGSTIALRVIVSHRKLIIICCYYYLLSSLFVHTSNGNKAAVAGLGVWRSRPPSTFCYSYLFQRKTPSLFLLGCPSCGHWKLPYSLKINRSIVCILIIVKSCIILPRSESSIAAW